VKNYQNPAWFKKIRGSYLPASKIGLAVYIMYISYLIAVPVAWYRNGHYLWDLLIYVIPALVGAALLTQYIASRHAR